MSLKSKGVRKAAGMVVAPVVRAITHLLVSCASVALYKFTVKFADPRIEGLKKGAVVAAKHASYFDAPVLMKLSSHITRMRPVAHRNQYKKWRWVMAAYDAIPTTPGALRHRGEKSLDIQMKVRNLGWTVLIFPSGKIEADGKTTIRPGSAGVYTMLQESSDKTLIMVRTEGMGSREKRLSGSWLRRHVDIYVSLYTNPDLSIGMAAFNKAMEDHLNHGTAIPEVSDNLSVA
jgi:1-acyl-sn-glycerol-3-phosphate acyltransferase